MSTDSSSSASAPAVSSRNSVAAETCCRICYEAFHDGEIDGVNASPTNPLERIATSDDCRHEFCRECLRQHCKHSLSKKQIPICCPFQNTNEDNEKCNSRLGAMLVRAILLQESVKSQDRDGYVSKFLEELSSDTMKPIYKSPKKRLRIETMDSSSTPTTVGSSDSYSTTPPLSNRYGSLGVANTGSSSSSDSDEDDSSDSPSIPTEQELDWIQFQRLHRLSVNKTLIPCTRCGEPVHTTATTIVSDPQVVYDNERMESGESSCSCVTRRLCQVTCLGCHHSFCSIHGDAHLSMTCEEYLQNNNSNQRRPDVCDEEDDDNIRKSERAIRELCKPCSHCQAPIQKAAGCDHIICPSCHDDMCFKCGTHVHMHGENMVRSCRKCSQSFIDHRYMGRYRIMLCLVFPIYLPFMILHMALTSALALVTCGCFCCFGCGVKKKEESAAEEGPKRDSDDKRTTTEVEYHPGDAIRSVLGIIFLPFVDLFHQCGWPCCCREDALWQERQAERSGVDMANTGEDEEYLDDEEFQLRIMSTLP